MSDMNAATHGKDRPAKYERRKAAILQAAVELINSKGVRGMTMSDVAARLDLVPTAVSYYFRRKEDLAAACLLEATSVYEGLIADAATERDPAAALTRFFRGFARLQKAIDTGARAPIASFNDVRTIHDQAVDAAFTEMFRKIRRTFNTDEKTELTRLRRNGRAHFIISQVFWSVLWLKRYDPADYERTMDRAIDILLNGLAAPGARWQPAELPALQQPRDAPISSSEAFLKAATEMVNEHGYLGASVARICKRLNVTKGSFYHHNETKDDLVSQCFDRTLSIVRDTQIASEAATSSGLDSLVTTTSILVEGVVSGEAPLLRTSALSAVPEELQADLIRRFDRTSARFASIISDGIADGSVRPVDANVAAQMVTATINAGAELPYWAPGVSLKTVGEIYTRFMFFGLFDAAN